MTKTRKRNYIFSFFFHDSTNVYGPPVQARLILPKYQRRNPPFRLRCDKTARGKLEKTEFLANSEKSPNSGKIGQIKKPLFLRKKTAKVQIRGGAKGK